MFISIRFNAIYFYFHKRFCEIVLYNTWATVTTVLISKLFDEINSTIYEGFFNLVFKFNKYYFWRQDPRISYHDNPVKRNLNIWISPQRFLYDYSSNGKWHTRRKLLTPTFHFKILEEFLATFNDQAAILSKKFDNQVGERVDCYSYLKMCALDIICGKWHYISKVPRLRDTLGV